MNYHEFKTALKEFIINTFFEDEPTVAFDTVLRTNEESEIMRVSSGCSGIALTFYPEELFRKYSSGTDFQTICKMVALQIYQRLNQDIPIPAFNREEAYKSISLSLINAAKNKELLRKCPHKSFLDLAIIPRWVIDGLGTMIIDKKFIESIDISGDEVFDIGYRNIENEDFLLNSISEICENLPEAVANSGITEIPQEYTTGLYIITTKEMVDGSRAILSKAFMDRVAEATCCSDFYVLPSSRHDLILLQYSDIIDAAELRKIVREVNIKSVDNVDFLSDEVYRYDCRKHELRLCN